MSKFSELSTDELSELLPNNLHPARNGYAREDDRWRMLNSGSNKYSNTGFSSLKKLLIFTLEEQESALNSWVTK
jgi:hypothetical protein